MILKDLQPVIALITSKPKLSELRAITYLATYPSICALGSSAGPIGQQRFHQLAAMAYGWMPRIVRLDPQHIENSIPVLITAQGATAASFQSVQITALADCLRSVVGASKVLHFINPTVFPIWDSNIERFRLQGEPPHNHMNSVQNYMNFANEVHAIRADNNFQTFYTQFNLALCTRLEAHGITPYKVSEVRAIEAAAFELSQ